MLDEARKLSSSLASREKLIDEFEGLQKMRNSTWKQYKQHKSKLKKKDYAKFTANIDKEMASLGKLYDAYAGFLKPMGQANSRLGKLEDHEIPKQVAAMNSELDKVRKELKQYRKKKEKPYDHVQVLTLVKALDTVQGAVSTKKR